MVNIDNQTSSPAIALQLHLVDDKAYVMESPFAEEKAKIWQSQVLISFSLEEKPLAFLGPLPADAPSEIYVDDKEAFFPTSTNTRPIISSPNPISLKYIDRNFRTAPPLHCPKVRTWMARLETAKGDQWKMMGIYTLLELSRCGQPYSSGMILAAIHF